METFEQASKVNAHSSAANTEMCVFMTIKFSSKSTYIDMELNLDRLEFQSYFSVAGTIRRRPMNYQTP